MPIRLASWKALTQRILFVVLFFGFSAQAQESRVDNYASLALPESLASKASGANFVPSETLACNVAETCNVPIQITSIEDTPTGHADSDGNPITLRNSLSVAGHTYEIKLNWSVIDVPSDMSDTSLANIKASAWEKKNNNSVVQAPFKITANEQSQVVIPINLEDKLGEYTVDIQLTDVTTGIKAQTIIFVAVEGGIIYVHKNGFTNIFRGIKDIPQRLHMLEWRFEKARQQPIDSARSARNSCEYLTNCTFKQLSGKYGNRLVYEFELKPVKYQTITGVQTGSVSFPPYTPIKITAEANFPATVKLKEANFLGKSERALTTNYCSFPQPHTPVCGAKSDFFEIYDLTPSGSPTSVQVVANFNSEDSNAFNPEDARIKVTIEELDYIPQ